MTKPIKLTADDFDYIHWYKDSGGPEQFELIIYGESKSNCEKIKQQILGNQEKLEKIKIIFDDGSVDDDTFFPKLEEIFGEKK